MSKHTPGPWSDFGPGSPQIYGGDPISRICVLDRLNGKDINECYANARLIAAAPELLEALQMMLQHFTKMPSTLQDSKARVMAHAAIRKATGE